MKEMVKKAILCSISFAKHVAFTGMFSADKKIIPEGNFLRETKQQKQFNCNLTCLLSTIAQVMVQIHVFKYHKLPTMFPYNLGIVRKVPLG